MSINKPVYINPTQGLSLPTYVSGQYLTNNGTTLSWAANGMGDLLANGTVPLTANWAMGAFELSQATWKGVAIAAGYGGTGLTSTGTTTVGKLADVAVGQVLASGGVGAVPAYTASPTLTGTLTASNLTASPTLAGTLLTNGDFTTDPTGTNTPWMEGTSTNIGTTWAWSSGKIRHATASNTTLRQAITCNSGDLLKVVFTIAQDGATPIAGTLKVTVGGTSSTGISDVILVAAGTYTRYLYASGTSTYYLTFTPTTTFAATIDDVSVQVQTLGIATSGGLVSNGKISMIMGDNGNPSLSLSQDPTTGLYFTQTAGGGYYLNFTTAGVGYVQIGSYNVSTLSNAGYFTLGTSSDLSLRWAAAASLQLGANAASPVDQTLKAHDASGNDGVGAMLTLEGGKNKGAGAGGGVKVRTADTGATASTAGVQYTRYRAVGVVKTLTDGSATDVISFAVVAGAGVGGMLTYTITVVDNDASDMQIESGTVIFAGLQDEANWHTNISEVSTQALESGALATTWAIDTATANVLKITCLADSDLTTPVITLRYQLHLNSPIVETVL
jgi:hypothetical protein